MAWQTISTLSTGNTLTDAHLNLLQANCEFLNDILTRSNWSCPAVHTNEGSFDNTDHIFRFRHQLNHLHYQIENTSGTLDYWRIFFNGHLVTNNEAPAGSPYTGSIDLSDITAYPNYQGQWAVSTAYYDSVDGDGEIVLNNSTVYYKCILGHTSSADDEPGVGANWETYWVQIAGPTIGNFYSCYFDIAFDGADGELAINYVYEDYAA